MGGYKISLAKGRKGKSFSWRHTVTTNLIFLFQLLLCQCLFLFSFHSEVSSGNQHLLIISHRFNLGDKSSTFCIISQFIISGNLTLKSFFCLPSFAFCQYVFSTAHVLLPCALYPVKISKFFLVSQCNTYK